MASADNKCCSIITHMCVYRLGFSFEFYVVRFVYGFYPYEKISWGQLPRFDCLTPVLEHTLRFILTLKVRFAVHNIPIMLSLLTQLFFCILQHSILMSVAGEDTAPVDVADMHLLPTVTYCEVYKES